MRTNTTHFDTDLVFDHRLREFAKLDRPSAGWIVRRLERTIQ